MKEDTIAAISTPSGTGGIAVIRLSGPDALPISQKVWEGKNLQDVKSHTAHFGKITDARGNVLDEALATVFRGPNSFTGEDTVEFSIHGSRWIQSEVMSRLCDAGARTAEAGEFTRRAFLNGKIDLARAEAIADVIASSSRAAHRLAIAQMSGVFSQKINSLRDRLIELASLLELELDFSEEDVEFADRDKLRNLTEETLNVIENLAATYRAGRAFKEGVPVVIAGSPNVGKSTLLNALLDTDKAIVTDIPGTTRDIIEDTAEIDGILFRFYDTAGLRETDDQVEKIGIDKAVDRINTASIVVWMIDAAGESSQKDYQTVLDQIATSTIKKHHILVYNKCDVKGQATGIKTHEGDFDSVIGISAKTGEGIEIFKQELTKLSTKEYNPDTELIVTNRRHYESLKRGSESLRRAREGMTAGLSADLIAMDIRETIHHLSTVTGEVSTDTLLETIFSKFCIGK